MKSPKTRLIYREQPVFGFDLGTRTAKLMQLHPAGKSSRVLGYGYATFPEDAVVEGIIVDPEQIAEALRPLVQKVTFGRLTTSRVAASLPVSKVFTRVLDLPPMNAADLDAAVRLEAEQYIPAPLPDLYIDYEVIEEADGRLDVLMVAAPRAIVDSYLKLFEILGLEVMLIESSLSAVTRAIMSARPLGQTTLVADFGSSSVDITVHDKVIRLTDTIALGGDDFTRELQERLGINHEQAHEIKVKFGLAPSGLQPKVVAAMGVPLGTLSGEMRRVIKYYASRAGGKRPVEAVVMAGGSATMPGLIEYMTAQLGLPVTVADPWAGLDRGKLPAVSGHDAPMYTTAIGLARLEGQL